MSPPITAPEPALVRTDSQPNLPPYEPPLQPLTPEEIAAIQLVGTEDTRNWSDLKKWTTTVIISFMGFISPLGASILVPGNMYIDRTFHLHSRTLSVLPVSLYVLGLGVGPFILAPISETKGRQPVFIITSLIFIIFNLGSSFSDTFAQLNVLRFMAGAAGSAGPSLGAGSIGDMFIPQERGRAQSLYGLGPLLGPVLGNVIGGFIAQGDRDWRWLLFTLTIMSLFVFGVIVGFLTETYTPVLLRRKRERAIQERLDLIQASLGVPPPPKHPLLARLGSKLFPSAEARTKLQQAHSRPFRLLFTNPICAIFSTYLGFCYGIIFLFLTQHPLLFQRRDGQPDAPPPDKLPTYNWSLGNAGLSYFGLGLGFVLSALTNVWLQDSIYQRLVMTEGRISWLLFRDRNIIAARMQESKGGAVADAEKEGAPTPTPKKGRPEYRLPLCFVGMLILPCGLICFGWSASSHTHWMLPLLGSFLTGYATILCFQTILVYLVDAFIPYSASATACAVLVRSLLAAAFPLMAEEMFEDLGYGWSCTLLAGVGLLGVPVPLILYRYGEGLRTKYQFHG